MNKKQKIIVIPVVVIVICVYLIGANLLNRLDRIDDDKISEKFSSYNTDIADNTDIVENSSDEAIEKVNINKADKAELMTVNGIGESRAEAIIKAREENGDFTSTEQLMELKSFNKKAYEDIKDYITVE